MKLILPLTLFFIYAISCAPFVDSPFSDQLLRPERNLNLDAMSDLSGSENDGLMKFALYADTHQNYAETDKMVFEINREAQIDFVVGLGDFTNSAYNLEYDEFIESISFLNFPVLNVIGNHDSIGAGPELYQKAFGPSNFYFETSNYRLIFFNTSNLETPQEFSPQWLKDRVDETAKGVLIFSHISLRNVERFQGNDAAVFNSVVTDPKVKAFFYGHDHFFYLSDDSGTVALQCGRVQGESGPHWLTVTIQGNQICIKRMDTGEAACRSLK